MELLEGTDDFSKVESDDSRREDAVKLAEAEDIEVATGAIRCGPTKIIICIERSKEVGEERMERLLLFEATEDGDFPPGTAISVGFQGQGGLLDDFEGERAAGGGII